MKLKDKKEIRELTKEELNLFVTKEGEKTFRANQIWEWIWLKNVRSFDAMTNLSKEMRTALNEAYEFKPLQINQTQKSEDGTMKFRFATYDNHFIEGVIIPSTHGLTACISSQIGCSLTCRFCATGKMDRVRNLYFYEIYDQVAIMQEQSQQHFGKRLTNLVYMGMGEPLLNYNHVLKSIEHITAPKGMGMSPGRITVSTSGISKQIKQLGDDKVKFNLALSLHAADNVKRSKIMPINDSNTLEDLVEALDYFFKKTKSPITYEYILFDGINDTEEDIVNLTKLCRRIPSKINIIEYNPVQGVNFRKPNHEVMDKFITALQKNKVNVRVRRSRGKDIDAACGQLANKG